MGLSVVWYRKVSLIMSISNLFKCKQTAEIWFLARLHTYFISMWPDYCWHFSLLLVRCCISVMQRVTYQLSDNSETESIGVFYVVHLIYVHWLSMRNLDAISTNTYRLLFVEWNGIHRFAVFPTLVTHLLSDNQVENCQLSRKFSNNLFWAINFLIWHYFNSPNYKLLTNPSWQHWKCNAIAVVAVESVRTNRVFNEFPTDSILSLLLVRWHLLLIHYSNSQNIKFVVISLHQLKIEIQNNQNYHYLEIRKVMNAISRRDVFEKKIVKSNDMDKL